mmetsp:Transcript_34287/g.73219  ORF Transcript_34287/g.73219 Transcript_34287/m.73219 type:complete len:276 (+) Transcript_34287:141-968(+)
MSKHHPQSICNSYASAPSKYSGIVLEQLTRGLPVFVGHSLLEPHAVDCRTALASHRPLPRLEARVEHDTHVTELRVDGICRIVLLFRLVSSSTLQQVAHLLRQERIDLRTDAIISAILHDATPCASFIVEHNAKVVAQLCAKCVRSAVLLVTLCVPTLRDEGENLLIVEWHRALGATHTTLTGLVSRVVTITSNAHPSSPRKIRAICAPHSAFVINSHAQLRKLSLELVGLTPSPSHFSLEARGKKAIDRLEIIRSEWMRILGRTAVVVTKLSKI